MERTLALYPQGATDPSAEALSWYKGALGEMAVAGLLAWLPDEWTVLHSVPVGGGSADIDHVVIGPPGVFTLNTKSHPDQELWIGGHGLLVSGQKTNYIGLAAAEAARASTLLSTASGLTVPVTPVLVFVRPGQRTVRALPEGGVRVLADSELLVFLQAQRREFSDEQLRRIVNVATRPITWHRSPAPEKDSRAIAVKFNALVARNAQEALLRASTVAPSTPGTPTTPSRAVAPAIPAAAPVVAAATLAALSPAMTARSVGSPRRPARAEAARVKRRRRALAGLGRTGAVALGAYIFLAAVLPHLVGR